jgi:hypothetical protein
MSDSRDKAREEGLMRRFVAGTALALMSVTAAAAVIGDPGPASKSEPTLDQVRGATAKYADVKVALAEGYIPDPSGMCETAASMGKPAALGAMGVHYFRPDMLGITAPPNPRVDGTSTYTDFHKPAVLLYEPQADGSLKLIGVENVVFEKAWRAAGHEKPPSFHGVAYDHMVDDPTTPIDEAHGFMPHYDRHVWILRDNPNGVFAQYNPNVTCKYAKPMSMSSTAK